MKRQQRCRPVSVAVFACMRPASAFRRAGVLVLLLGTTVLAQQNAGATDVPWYLPYVSGGFAAAHAARVAGTEGGATPRFAGGLASAPLSFGNVGIATDPNRMEYESTAAANPKDGRKLVAGSNDYDPLMHLQRVSIHTSNDGGATWSVPHPMPSLVNPAGYQGDPAIADAPDGSRVFCSYLFDGLSSSNDISVAVAYSDDDGLTWQGPCVALQAK